MGETLFQDFTVFFVTFCLCISSIESSPKVDFKLKGRKQKRDSKSNVETVLIPTLEDINLEIKKVRMHSNRRYDRIHGFGFIS